MRRRPLLITLAVLTVLGSILSCSKKSAAPTAPIPPACQVSPSSLDFGTVAAGQTASRAFTVTNTGGGVLSGTVSVPAGPFSLDTPPSYSLGAGESITATVRYTWQQAGPATTTASSGASCGTVACTAVGGPSPCGVSPTSLAFGSIRLEDTRSLTFTVTNSGATSFIAVPAETCADFAVIPSNGYIIDAGRTVTFTVTFAPTRSGAQVCRVHLANLCADVLASGTGVATACYVAPLTLDFGTVHLTDYATQVLDIRNDGSTTLPGSVGLPALDAQCGSFWFPDHDTTYSLAPGASKSILVAISPRLIGSSVTCDLATGPAGCAPVTCQANVIAPEFGSCSGWSVTPATVDFGSVTIGQSVTRSIHISAPADCVYSGARMDVILAGPDFTFLDGTAVKHVSLDLAVNWTFDVRFTPTVEGQESFALVTYRACGPPGSAGFPCQGILGSGTGVRMGEVRSSHWPAPWKP